MAKRDDEERFVAKTPYLVDTANYLAMSRKSLQQWKVRPLWTEK